MLFSVIFASAAGEYDVRIQDIHSRGLFHEEYANTLCSTTSIALNVPKLSNQDQIFVYHTPTVGTAGVFDFKRDRWVFSGGKVSFNPWYRYNEGVPDCIGSYSPSVTGNYALYKSFSFPVEIPVDSSTRKLIVLIHGWNPDELENPYAGYSWPSLVSNLNDWVSTHSNWKVLAYNWADDAATGPVLDLGSGGFDVFGKAIKNGTQAAEISHQHGQHLGSVIKNTLPNLEKIHFIAHSAGTWNARSCAIYLSQNCSNIQIQVTLLDPYIPGEAPDADSDCIIGKVNQLASLQQINLLENYYYSNDVSGTESIFSWRTQDINKKLGSSFLLNPYNHMKPVEWYGNTITENATDGWSHSLAFSDTLTNGAVTTEIRPPSGLTVTDVSDDNGHQLLLTWSLSPDDPIITNYEIYRSRNAAASETRELSEFSSIHDLSAAEETYIIHITTVLAGITRYTDSAVPLNSVQYCYWIAAAGKQGTSKKIPAGIITCVEQFTDFFIVYPPFPNPCNPSTTITYTLRHECHFTLAIYDILGREIAVLSDGMRNAGTYSKVWNGTDNHGNSLASGVYLYMLKAGTYIHHGKVVLMR